MAIGSDALALLFKIKADGSQAKSEVASVRSVVSKEVRQIGEEFGSQIPVIGRFSNLMTPTALGIAAVGVAGVALGAGLLKLAKDATEVGSRFNDLSLKSGLTVESLSGLELQLKQSGTSLEALTTGFFNLQKQQAAARQGSDEAAAALKRVGVDASATAETALRQFVRGLMAIEDAGARNAAGAAVMGRSYKELAVFIADTGGDLDKVIEKARAAGLVMSTEAAQAADRLGDQFDKLTYSLSAMGRQMISPVLPAFIGALNDITGASAGTVSGLNDIGMAIASIIDGGRIAAAVLKGIADNDIYRIPGAIEQIRIEQRARALGPPAEDVYGPGGTARGGGSRSGLEFEVDEEAEKKAQAERERKAKAAQAARDKEVKDLQEHNAHVLKLLRIAYDARLAEIDRGERLGTLKHKEALNLRSEEEKKFLNAQRDALIAESKLAVERRASADVLRETRRALEVYNAEVTVHNSQLLTRAADALQQDTIKRLDNLDAILKQIGALRDLNAIGGPVGPAQDVPVFATDNLGRPLGAGNILSPEVIAGLGPDLEPVTDRWKDFKEGAFDALLGVETEAGRVGGVLGDVFAGMAEGIGSAVKAWLMFGNAGGGFKKMAAEVVSSVAAMSAVQAVFELAQGFAMLALTWFTGNPKFAKSAADHFVSAAIFGTVAGIAGAAAKGLSAGGFGGSGAGAGVAYAGGGSGGNQDYRESRRSEYEREQAERDRFTRREDRREEFIVQVNTHIDGEKVGESISRVYRRGGTLRQTLRSDLGFAT